MIPFLRRHAIPLLALATGALVLAATALLLLPSPVATTVSSGIASVGGPFRLTTHEGKTLTEADLKGRPFAVFFGFTHCPDVCPTTLFDMTELLKELGPEAQTLQVLFVSVDPEQDKPELLRTYLESFDPRIVGLTGSEAEIQATAKAYRAFYRKVPLKDGGGYTMEHTANVYLMDRQGRFFTALNYQDSRDAKLAKLRRLVKEG